MIEIADSLEFDAAPNIVWDLINDFDTFASCIPTLKEYTIVDDTHIEGVVGLQLGVIPIESKVKIEITKTIPPSCIEIKGISYLGETIENINKDIGKKSKLNKESVGRFTSICNLIETSDGNTTLEFKVQVDAEGKLQRIYESIIKLKLPTMQQEFYDKFAEVLSTKDITVTANKVEKDSIWSQILARIVNYFLSLKIDYWRE